MVLAAALLAPLNLPLLSFAATAKFAAASGAVPQIERGKTSPLPQWLADRTGWESMLEDVTAVFESLPPEQRAHALIFAPDYGTAGALELWGPARGLPRVISTQNSFYHWSQGHTDSEVLIAIGVDADHLRERFDDVRLAGRISCTYWQKRALGTHLDRPTSVPNLIVSGWWDQEDFVGPIDIYNHVERFDEPARVNHLVVGPWNHGSFSFDGTHLGPIDFGADRSKEFRGTVRKWFAACLRGGPALHQPEAQVFETGSNRWRDFDAWPPRTGVTSRRLYLRGGGKLAFEPPTEAGEVFDEYVSDPANPVPYRKRPIGPTYAPPWEWMTWLVQDQRFVERRPDVLTWSTDVLDRDIVIAGDVVAELFASTSGTDSDWVVKLIDVYPDGDEAPAPDAGADLRGYELMIVDEVLRARYRNSFETPEPVPANTAVKYAIDLHTNTHAFLKGHRIMVQVQSSWFPVLDRNPQKYVDSIYLAKDEDFIKATQRVFRSSNWPSAIVLPVLGGK